MVKEEEEEVVEEVEEEENDEEEENEEEKYAIEGRGARERKTVHRRERGRGRE